MTRTAPTSAVADLCNVMREGDDVVIHFGQLVTSGVMDGALGAHLHHRIAMSAGGAAKLQDLLMALLREAEADPGREPVGGT